MDSTRMVVFWGILSSFPVMELMAEQRYVPESCGVICERIKPPVGSCGTFVGMAISSLRLEREVVMWRVV